MGENRRSREWQRAAGRQAACQEQRCRSRPTNVGREPGRRTMSSPRQGKNIDFDIISAIATRDAAVEDIVRELRNRGVKSLEDLLDMMRQAVARRDDSAKAT